MIRAGQGFDAHRFSEDPERPLVLAGVTVDGAPGLAGHSDADVATHALCDALLGAAGLGDLGRRFPDSDPALAGISSISLLATCCGLVRDAGFEVANADLTIIAQTPRLVGHIEEMAASLTTVVGAPVSVKATSTDEMGSIGRREGIAASAVVLLTDEAR